jgi:VWFA-related protein
MRGLMFVAAAVAVAGGLGRPDAASPQTAQAPVFRSGIELVSIDVSVVDKSGNPIRQLRPDQFDVTVDGKPRRVVTAEFVDFVPAPPVSAASAAVPGIPAPAYSSNDSPAASAQAGRLVIIAVDQGSFRPFGARAAAEAARRFIDRLQPQDRLGLVAFPAPGPTVAPSKNHAAVRDALVRIIGSADAPGSSMFARGMSLSLAESLDIEALDEFATKIVVDRVCERLKGFELAACQNQVVFEAHSIAISMEQQATRSVRGLRGVVDALGSVPDRKTLVLISAGMPSADRFGGGLDMNAEIAAIGRAAALANANIYVLHVDKGFLDAFSAESRSFNNTLSRDLAMFRSGLETMAGASGGSLFTVVAAADFAFERVLKETAAAYLLGIEPTDGDRNGKPHAIAVRVTMPGVQVRSRREFVLNALPAGPEAAENRLAGALKSPRLAVDLPLGVSTHTLGMAESGSVRVLITANVGRGLVAPIDAKVGYVITDATGRVVGNAVEKRRLPVSRASAAGSVSYIAVVGLKPGEYHLRLAVEDPSGRIGSVDHPFAPALADGEGVRMSDLLLVDPARSAEDGLAPVADGRLGGGAINAYLEIYPRKTASAVPTVVFHVADKPDGPPLLQARARVDRKEDGGRLIAEALLDLRLLPPGDYVAVVDVRDGSRLLGRRYQPLRLERATPAAGDSSDSAPEVRVRFVAGDSSSLVKTFSRRDVLGTEALAFFVGRMRRADRAIATAGVTSSAEAVESGQFDAALAALKDLPSDSLSVAFLKGLALLGKNELEPAAREFREAVRIADDFLPAAFYLGACYAAGGRDSEAVGAWQTALITESDARIVYDVLVDALLRTEDADQAIEILGEARQRWPDDATFVPRLAAAQAMRQNRSEALATLEGYLDAHRSDTEALALAIRLLYEAHAAGRAVKSAAADRELAAAYATWYKTAGGSNAALIDRWVGFILKS